MIWLQFKFVKRTLIIILEQTADHKFHEMTSVQTHEEQRAEQQQQHATQDVMNEPARGSTVHVSTSSPGYFTLANLCC